MSGFTFEYDTHVFIFVGWLLFRINVSLHNWLIRFWLGALRWRHNGRDGVSNHQTHDCLLNRLFGRRSKKTSKLRVTGLCAGNSPETGEFSAQMASNAENVSIWWRHPEQYDSCLYNPKFLYTTVLPHLWFVKFIFKISLQCLLYR